MEHGDDSILVDGRSLRCEDVVAVGRKGTRARVDDAARQRAKNAHEVAESVAQKRAVYGRTTGVGANKQHIVDIDAGDDHGLRLVRSHAGGVGPLLASDHVRAALVIRLNQLAAGGSGVHPQVLDSLEHAIRSGAVPAVHRVGAVGTGDLAALAEIALALAGERPWGGTGEVAPIQFGSSDALAFMSSNAVTLAEAAFACADLQASVRASHAIAALSFLALGASPESFAAPPQQARNLPGQASCAAEMRRLLGIGRVPLEARRIQDPFSLRAYAPVHGAALDSLTSLENVLETEINARSENPLIDVDSADVFHNANFHTAHVTLALDQARAAIYQVAELSAARLASLNEPTMTGLQPFLTSGPPGASGAMILEYVAHDALAQARLTAAPVNLGNAVISRGVEDHATFATQAARQSTSTVHSFRYVLACELVAGVRALRLQGADLSNRPVRTAWERATVVLDPALEDRSLSDDVERAAALIPELADL